MNQSAQLSAFTRAFLLESPEGRQGHLELRSAEQREVIFEEWAQHPDFMLADLFDPDISEDSFFRMERWLNGNSKHGIPSARRTFYVKPNPEWKPGWDNPADNWAPSIEIKMRYNKRTFQRIDRPTELPSALAITAFSSFGPTGKFKHLRGALVEITRREYLSHQAEVDRKIRETEEADIASNEAQVKASTGKRGKRT